MNRRNRLRNGVGFIVAAMMVFQAQNGWAAFGRYDRHDRYGQSLRRLPWGARSVVVANETYLYYSGVYYRRFPRGYVVVPAPMGAVVDAPPPGYVLIKVRGAPYYYCDGIYYQQVPQGYAVVEQPGILGPAGTSGPAVSSGVSITAYDIYIPNRDGSYTLVTLKKAEKGFIGPQGEFYPEHPTVEQLKALYGKK